MLRYYFLFLFSFNLISPMADPDSTFTPKGLADFWVKENKESLKEKFLRLRELLLLDKKCTAQRGQLSKEEFAKQEELRFEEFEYAIVRLGNVFRYGVTQDKVDAYLEVTSSTPNDPLDWIEPREYNRSLLTMMTESAINEQRVFRNTPCATSVIEMLLKRGGDPDARPHHTHASASEIVKMNLEKYSKESKEWRNSNDPYAKQYQGEAIQACDCSKKLIALFEKYRRK